MGYLATPRRRLGLSSMMILLSSLTSPFCESFQTAANRRRHDGRRRHPSPTTEKGVERRSSSTTTTTTTTTATTSHDESTSTMIVDDVGIAYSGKFLPSPSPSPSSSSSPAEEARDILALENEVLGPDGVPFAPMMTYQKYLTMQQEKRVKVTVRYSAEAGLRPFYLTVANRIKSAHPDVLLEKRILPRAGSEGGTEAVFEVIIDGKTVIGKKKTKMLKVSSRAGSSSRLSAPGDDDEGDGKMMGGDKKDGGKRKGDAKSGGYYGEGRGPPDVAAGGRTIFVSMEKLDHELAKARKKRRPSTTYKTKEDALRGVAAGARMRGTPTTAMLGMDEDMDVSMRMAAEGEMAEAVIRLERLKAMSTRSKI